MALFVASFDSSGSDRTGPVAFHRVHVIGEPLLDEDRCRIAVVMSSENLLLNPIRAEKRGMGIQLMVDTEHRLVDEGYSTMLIGVAGLNQVFHVVAYAICNKEDAEAHEFCFRQLKKGIEDAVKRNHGKWV